MKLIFRQTGGTTGLIKTADIDSDHLPAEESAALRNQVMAAGLLEAKSSPRSPSSEVESYYLEVMEGKRRNTVIYTAGNIPPAIQPLIQILSAKAKFIAKKK